MTQKKALLLVSVFVFGFISFQMQSIFTTFFASFGVAYLLQPLAKRVSKITKLPFWGGAVIVYLAFMVAIISVFILIAPILLDQVDDLFLRIPEFQQSIQKKLIPLIESKSDSLFGRTFTSHIKNVVETYFVGSAAFTSYTANFVLASVLSTFNLISMFLLFPVLLLFFLKDWDDIAKGFEYFIKKSGFDDIHLLLNELDEFISGFIRALLNIASILGLYYILSLSLIGVEYALLLGILCGVATLVPFIGLLFSFSFCISISVLLHGVDEQQLWILLAFTTGQIVDSSYLTPKIVGDSIGIHPTVIIFAVFAGSAILGAAGLFLAIPIAGVIKIIYKRAILGSGG